MTPQELKNSILQLAIQGKLVEQRADEGTGAELLEKIFAAKNAEGAKGKGEKSHAKSAKSAKVGSCVSCEEIPDDEKPFDIPESWEWVRLESIINSVPTKQYQILESEVCSSGRFAVISQSKEYSIGFTDKSDKVYRHANPVIVFGDHTAEVKYVEFDFVVGADGVKVFEPKDSLITAKLLFYILQHYSCDLSKVGGYSRHYKFLKNKLIPLPPLAEQKRIVAKIEELMPLVERYENAWSKLKDFNKRFPADMQKSLLQMAIQGKLVEQRAEEGTGRELLERILAAKNAEGAKGKGEKSHAKSAKSAKVGSRVLREEIPDDEKPFDIPESWEWVRLGEVFAHNTGKAMNSSAKAMNKPGAIRKFITTSNLYWDRFDFSTVKEMFFTDDELDRCSVTKNDILVCEGGAYYGRTAIWNYDYDICFQNHIHRLRSYVQIEGKYFYHLLRFYRETGMMKSQGTAMPGLSSKVLHDLVLPLPPLAEQKRIVAKLEELLPLCERLK